MQLKEELVRWYGTFMLVENTYKNEHTNLRQHFKYIQKRYRNNHISIK